MSSFSLNSQIFILVFQDKLAFVLGLVAPIDPIARLCTRDFGRLPGGFPKPEGFTATQLEDRLISDALENFGLLWGWVVIPMSLDL